MKINIKKLYEDAQITQRAHTYDAGMDLFAHRIVKAEDDKVTYGTGIALEIPEGYVGLAFPRSSIKNTNMRLSNSVGVIDAGYQGEIFAVFDTIDTFIAYRKGDEKYDWNTYPENGYECVVECVGFTGENQNYDRIDNTNWYKVGDKILQIVIVPIPQIELNLVEQFENVSERGEKGFGSSGK